MAVIPMPDNSTLNLSFVGELSGQAIVTTFQYFPDPGSSSNPATNYTFYLDAFLTEIFNSNALLQDYLAVMPDNYNFSFAQAQLVRPFRLRYLRRALALTGTWGADASTPNVAASIERHTDDAIRRGVGRINTPVPDGVYADGVITSAPFLAEMGDLGVEMLKDVVTTVPAFTWNPVISTVNQGLAYVGVLSGFDAKETVRTMSRRTVGRGI